MAMRTFEDKPAVRTSVPLLIGLMGPSGGGKTYSALRLATGIQKVSGGDIYIIDTEARRSLHYADRFRFRHLEFAAPFGPLDYLAAVEHCMKKGAKVVIVDSMSHEHEGPGGVLEQHETEQDRLAQKFGGYEKANFAAWAKPKADRRRLINSLLQMPINTVFCFRAKEKLKIARGGKPEPMGYMAIAGEEFVYEMTINCLLMPGANGVPTWQSQETGENAMIKLPAQFRDLVLKRNGPLDENVGEELARWAAGDVSEAVKLMGAIRNAITQEQLDAVKTQLTAAKEGKRVKAEELKTLATAFKERSEEMPGIAKRRAEAAARAQEEEDATNKALEDLDAKRAATPDHDPATGEVREPGVSATGEAE